MTDAVEKTRDLQMQHLAMVAMPAFVAHLNWQERSHTEEDAWRFFGELEDALRDPEVADAVMKLAKQTARDMQSHINGDYMKSPIEHRSIDARSEGDE